MTDDENRPDPDPTDTSEETEEEALPALHPGEVDGDPDTLIGDLTDPDVDVDALLTDEDGRTAL